MFPLVELCGTCLVIYLDYVTLMFSLVELCGIVWMLFLNAIPGPANCRERKSSVRLEAMGAAVRGHVG